MKDMGYFITEKETEALLIVSERSLPMPDGSSRSFSGPKVLWRAFDFLVVCDGWSRLELTSLALAKSQNLLIALDRVLPRGELPASMLAIEMLEAHRIDPVIVTYSSPVAAGAARPPDSLDEHLHGVVAELYKHSQDRLDSPA